MFGTRQRLDSVQQRLDAHEKHCTERHNRIDTRLLGIETQLGDIRKMLTEKQSSDDKIRSDKQNNRKMIFAVIGASIGGAFLTKLIS